MDLSDVEWRGPAIDDQSLASRLPVDYRDLLPKINGFVKYRGGLHVRGVCSEPRWHSLAHVWTGELALHSLYKCIKPDDVPFAQSAFSDQFLLRDGRVYRLTPGLTELELYSPTLGEFLESADADPVEYLELHPLVRLEQESGRLRPGQGVSVYPPFIFKESGAGAWLRAVPSLELIAFIADLAKTISDLPDGATLEFKVVDQRP